MSRCTHAALALLLLLVLSSAPAAAEQADAVELVRRVRADEAWLHDVESLYLRTESARQTADGRRPVSVLELAWDDRRMYSRYAHEEMQYPDGPIFWEDLRIFDGERVVHRYRRGDDDRYVLADEPYEFLGRLFFSYLMWPRARAHEGFWWIPEDDPYAAGSVTFFGEPQEYRLAGREEFHGVECYVLERDAFYMRLYVGVEDHRQYGTTSRAWSRETVAERLKIITAIAEEFGGTVASFAEFREWQDSLPAEQREAVDREYWQRQRHLAQPNSYRWTLDWQEVAPGRWFPMRQGHRTFPVPELGIEEGDSYEQQIVELKVNEPLEDELFALEIPEGARVTDRRFDPLLVVYEQKADRSPEQWHDILEEARQRHEEDQQREQAQEALIGQPAPALPEGQWLNSEPLLWEDLAGEVVLLEFWAEWCGPCRRDFPRLAELHRLREETGIIVIGIHTPGSRIEDIEKVMEEFDMEFPVAIDRSVPGRPAGWGRMSMEMEVWAIPHAVVIDREGRVAAHGMLEQVLPRAQMLAAIEPRE